VNVHAISGIIKTAMGNISGIGDILSNVDDTIQFVCETTSSNNRFIKAELSQCGTMLVGVSMYAVANQSGVACLNRYTTKLHCKMISAKVNMTEEKQVEDIKKYFDEKFNKIINQKRVPTGLCGVKEIDSQPKLKNYEVALIDDNSE
jgi:hypothetical protein